MWFVFPFISGSSDDQTHDDDFMLKILLQDKLAPTWTLFLVRDEFIPARAGDTNLISTTALSPFANIYHKNP